VKGSPLLLLLCASPLWAQSKTVEADPVRCWLKTDKVAVHIGEQFGLSLTCAVVDAGHVTVEPDLARIEPDAIQLAPFEVVRGTHHPDIRAGVWRYIQYDYVLRILQDGFFGQDVEIPAATLNYSVHTTAGTADQVGIARSYVLPVLTMRVHSLVPQNANDIRDVAASRFAQIDARKFRATAAMTAATILFVFAALFFLLGLVRGSSGLRKRARSATPTVSAGAALSAAVRVLDRTATQVEANGWSTDSVVAALGAARLGASVAAEKGFAQIPATNDVNDREGQIPAHLGLIRRREYLVSGAVTPGDLPHDHPLREALNIFSEARYGRDAQLDRASLDRALDQTRTALRSLRLRQLWPAKLEAFRRLAWTR
jgi:hypothetical protein